MLAFSASAQELIAVLDLKSDGSVSQKNIRAISDQISAEIAWDARLTVFDRQNLPVLLDQLKITASCADAKCLSDVGNQIGANQIVGGSLRLTHGELCIELRRVDVQSQKTMRTVKQKMAVTKEEFMARKLPDFVRDLMSSSEPIALKTKKKGFFSHPGVWVGAASVAAAGAAAVVLMLPKKGTASAEETDLSLDPPEHAR